MTRTIAIISARGGSKRIPRKNITNIAGQPLIAWTIQAALAARCIDRLILSTDDKEIADVASCYGCEVPFMRPMHLASDSASSSDVISHALDNLPGYSNVILLQPTSPLRRSEHIDEAFKLFLDQAAHSCISVRRVRDNPNWMNVKGDDGFMKKINYFNFDKFPIGVSNFFIPNGAIYIVSAIKFKEYGGFYTDRTIPYIMGDADSVDIDNFEDLSSPYLAALNGKKFDLDR